MVRLTGNASAAAGRLAVRLATPDPWEALAARVSRAAQGSRRWAGARARALQGVAGRATALLAEELAIVRTSAAWRRVDAARRRLLLAGHRLLLLVWKLGVTAGAAGGRRLRQWPRGRGAGRSSPPADTRSLNGLDARQRDQLAEYARVLQSPDHYAVLALSSSCSVREVRSSFRKLSLLLHPDKLRQLAHLVSKPEAAFQSLQAAHEVLADERLRALYDLDLELRGTPRKPTPYQAQAQQQRQRPQRQRQRHGQKGRAEAWGRAPEYDIFASLSDALSSWTGGRLGFPFG